MEENGLPGCSFAFGRVQLATADAFCNHSDIKSHGFRKLRTCSTQLGPEDESASERRSTATAPLPCQTCT